MYSKVMKKSIPYLLAFTLLFTWSIRSKAANTDATIGTGPYAVRFEFPGAYGLNPDNAVELTNDGSGNRRVRYDIEIPITLINSTSDSNTYWLVGWFTCQMNYTISNSAGTYQGAEMYFEGYNSDSQRGALTAYNTTNTGSANFHFWFANYQTRVSSMQYPLGILHMSFYYTYLPNVTISPLTFTVSPTVTNSILNYYAAPNTTQGMAALILESVNRAIHENDLDTIAGILTSIANNTYLLNTVISTLQIANVNLEDIQDKLTSLYNQVGTYGESFLAWYGQFSVSYASIIARLNEIKNILESSVPINTEGNVIASSAVEGMESAASALQPATIPPSQIFNAIDSYIPDVDASQNELFFWLNRNSILVTILVSAISLGIVGFIIYGKSG